MKKLLNKKNLGGSKLVKNGKLPINKSNSLVSQPQRKEITNNVVEHVKGKSQIQQNHSIKNINSISHLKDKSQRYFFEEQTRITEQQSNFDSNQVIEKNLKINTQLAHHIDDIWDYVLQRQKKYQIDCHYLRNQKKLNAKFRNSLVRLLFNLYNSYSLQRTTLYLSVLYMDLYFSKVNNFKDHAEIVGIAQACMLIAMKYQEIYPPELSQWMNTRFFNDIIQNQAKILKVLDYQITHYTLQHFFHFVAWKQKDCRQQLNEIELKALFLMDLSLFELGMSQFKASQLARCLYYYSQNRVSQCDKNIFVSIKWMIQKNSQSIQWLSNHNYRGIDFQFIC